jgi:hypothetical protein
MLDIYTYLFQSSSIKKKSQSVKTLIDYKDLKCFIKAQKPNKKEKSKNVLVYEIYDHARLEYNLDHYYGYTTIFNNKNLDKVMDLIDVINKFNHINYNIIESKIEWNGVDMPTVYILNNINIPFLNYGYDFLQANIPYNDMELLKSNSYYYAQYVNQTKNEIVNMSMTNFIKFLKRVYGDKFDQKDYLKEIEELEKFKMKLPRFMKEKARLPGFDEPEDAKGCFDFFYHRMKLILEDLNIRPSHFVKFY